MNSTTGPEPAGGWLTGGATCWPQTVMVAGCWAAAGAAAANAIATESPNERMNSLLYWILDDEGPPPACEMVMTNPQRRLRTVPTRASGQPRVLRRADRRATP